MSEHTALPWYRGNTTIDGCVHIRAGNHTIIKVWDWPDADDIALKVVLACNHHEELVGVLKSIYEDYLDGKRDVGLHMEEITNLLSKIEGAPHA